jgi:ParB family chromosome partitioning protein
MKRGLGKGFDALIAPDMKIEDEFDITAADDKDVSDLRNLKISDISPNADQPRRDFDEEALELLASSIKTHGLMQPIVVSPKGAKFEIVAGERRWRAAKLAGLETIKAIVRSTTGQQKLELALIENLHREDLNPLETATAYLKLRDQFNMSLQDIAEEMNGARKVQTISNTLRLLQLPDFAKTALSKGEITEGHARQVLALAPDTAAQRSLMNKIIVGGWSVRRAEQYVVALKNADADKMNKKSGTVAAVRETAFTRGLAKKIGGVKIEQKITTKKGAGKIIISFHNPDELKKIEDVLG